MRLYELTYLIKSNLSEQKLKDLSEKINSFIQERGGILDEASQAVTKKLGYSVKKERSAFLKTTTFYLNPEKLESLDKKLKETSGILRYLFLTRKVKKATTKASRKAKISKKAKRKPKVELKEIEKKLEEILEE